MGILVIILVAILAIFVLGWILVGLAFKLLWWALVGLVIGALARLILPGRQELSIIATAGVGIVASILGGVIAYALDLGGFLQFVVAVGLAVAIVAFAGGTRLARV